MRVADPVPLTAVPSAGVLVAAALLAGCAGGAGGGGASGPAPNGVAWQRDVAPFAVTDSAGEPYDHPFLGGFDVPRPQLIDIDGDGDLDLFVQERSNEVMFLENVGSPSAATYAWRTDKFRGLDIGEWYRFVDVDEDGDIDLLSERPFSHIRYYRNEGTPARADFVVAADTLRTVDGAPIFSDRQNIPNATDLDCNGRLDLFVGRLTGTVTRYEAAEAGPAVPRFRLVSERFENIEIVNQMVGSLHGANTMDFADHDGDGDKDLFWGDFFEPGLLLLENVSTTCASPTIRNTPVPFPPSDPLATTGYNAPTLGDLNGDGRPDMLLGVLGGAYNPTRSAQENLYHLEQTAAGFELRTRRFLRMVDLGSETVPAVGDLDGDGDLDLLVGSKIEPDGRQTGLVHHFENIGSATRPSYRKRASLPITGSYHYAPGLGDLDGDGDLDLLVGTWSDGVLYYRNDGDRSAPGWTLAGEPLVELTRGSNTTPALGDLDGDGDLDLVVGESSGALNYYRNDGGPGEPRFELVSDEWLGIDPGRRSHPTLVDIDGDDDLDLLLGHEDGTLKLYRNQGSATAFELVEEPAPGLPGFPYSAPAFADLDGDGALDLLIGGLSGGLVYYRR